MRAIDANVLVRLITRDDSRHAASAESFIERAVLGGKPWESHPISGKVRRK